MWQRFTERARKVVFYSQEEAGRLGENYVSTEHLLLGLTRENDSAAARLLDSAGVSQGRLRAEIERQITHGDGRLGQDMQLTPRAKRVIDLAYDEARQLNNNFIGTEHLLMGLLRESEGLAGRILKKQGLKLEALREAVRQIQTTTPPDESVASDSPDDGLPSLDLSRSSDTQVIRIANTIIQQAIREGAIDIHVERRDSGVRILYRIDGILSEMMTVPSHVKEELVTRFKTMADLDTARHDFPQQGTIHLRLEGSSYDLRVSALPIRNGEKLVIHIPQEFPVGLAKLGLLEDDLTTARAWMARRSGLILVSGSTGAGKTATSLNLLRETTDAGGVGVALQNPFEREFPGVTTFSVDAKSGVTVERALEAALLGAPDVISVYSVLSHSSETLLRSVLDVAFSGPLVLMEYHAPSAAGAINRILNWGIPLRSVNDALIGIVGQSLVRRICESCKRPVDQILSSQMREESRLAGFDPPADVALHEGAGCDECRGTGYKGRIGLFELLPWNKDTAEAVLRQASAEELTSLTVTHGMKTRFADGICKAVMGLTTIEEVKRRVI